MLGLTRVQDSSLLDLSGCSPGNLHSQTWSLFDLTQNSDYGKSPIVRASVENNQQQLH